MKSLLMRLITSGLEKTASRAAPANTQQRASSIGRSMKIQSNTGFFFSRDSLSPSSRQLFQAISRQTGLGAFHDSISARKASGVAGFLAATEAGCAQPRPANSTVHTATVRLRMVVPPSSVDEPTRMLVSATALLYPAREFRDWRFWRARVAGKGVRGQPQLRR